jgi:phosphate transport system protein
MDKVHTDRQYEAELQQVRENLLRMAGYVEAMITDAGRALIKGDLELARATIDADSRVNTIEMETDELCLLILAKRQPMASDLRTITLAMKMVTDLERIGDLAVNISERALALGTPPRPTIAERIDRMTEAVQHMIRDAIDAFVRHDAELARAIFGRDEKVDDLYRELSNDLQDDMHADTDFVARGIHLQAVAKFLERIGDHATNLAELVIFQVEGQDVRHHADRLREARAKGR